MSDAEYLNHIQAELSDDMKIIQDVIKNQQNNLNSWARVINEKGETVTADNVMRKYMGDSIPNLGNSSSYANIGQINSLALDNAFLGWGELSLLQQNAIVQMLCNTVSTAMTEKWITLHHKDGNLDKITLLDEAIRKYKLKEIYTQAIYKTMLLGTCYISPKLKDDDDDLENPLPLSNAKIAKGSLEAFYAIEPTWVVPIDFNMNNPRSSTFYKPASYVVYGKRIHKDRMQKITLIDPVNLLAPIYLFGGQPPIQSALPYILDFMNTKREVVKIISRYNISILKTDFNALVGKPDAYGQSMTMSGNLAKRGQVFTSLRNNFGLLLVDKNEEFLQMQMNLSGLEGVLQQQGELIALIQQMPVSKLFGQAPRGMNATGEFDANNWNELIYSRQEHVMRENLQHHINLIQLSEFGEIDPSITFDFVPLGSLNELSQSQIKNETLNRYLAVSQVADPESVLDLIKNDEDLGMTGLKAPEYEVEDGDIPDSI